jgi:hypothetical protein
MGVGHEEFLTLLAERFPDVIAQIRPDERGLLHLEVSAFGRATVAAMDSGRLWAAEQHFRFVAELLTEAGPELLNALEVSYLEELALGECTPARHRAVKERMPQALRKILIGYHEQWQ